MVDNRDYIVPVENGWIVRDFYGRDDPRDKELLDIIPVVDNLTKHSDDIRPDLHKMKEHRKKQQSEDLESLELLYLAKSEEPGCSIM